MEEAENANQFSVGEGGGVQDVSAVSRKISPEYLECHFDLCLRSSSSSTYHLERAHAILSFDVDNA